jgi:hypothetical protein
MTRVIEYDNRYNTEYWDYWACRGKSWCKPGDIDSGMLVLSEDNGPHHWLLVDLRIVRKYEHDGVIYEVQKTKAGKYKIISLGETK